MPFNKKLRSLRLEHNMTQDYVAQRMNVARSTIAGYETKGRQPSHEKLAVLAGLFNVTIDYLLDEDETITLAPSNTSISVDTDQLLLDKYHMLSPSSQADLLAYLNLLELRDNAIPTPK